MRLHISKEELGIKLSKGSRVDNTRWNEFLGIQEAGEEPDVEVESPAAVPRMRVCSATMRFCGTVDVDAIAAELRRVFDGTTQGEIEISFTVKDE